MRNIYYLKAVSEALLNEMNLDPDVIIIGEDVRYSLRGITKGFIDIFGPDRIIDSPISESGLKAGT
jgi:pyruvate dehydrogenase E1 component beta subunit